MNKILGKINITYTDSYIRLVPVFPSEAKWVLLFLIIGTNINFGQSIRKDYREMTEYEKSELVNAFYSLREGADLIQDLADFHQDYFNLDNIDPNLDDIHFNLPDEPERDIFLAWHRRQMLEVELAMQKINPRISMPFWNSVDDQSETSLLWDFNFMGSFDQNWDLNRSFGDINWMPTSGDVADLLGRSDFLDFSNRLERGRVHTGAHRWTGGAMPTSASPRDPVFYLHHTFVDLVWDDWQKEYGTSSFIKQDMLRYDGTYVFDGETLPSVNPNDIVETEALGVFYARDGLAVLENYSVTNNHNSIEYFYYQFSIEAGNNFRILSNRSAIVESRTGITLQPGFYAETGSEFIAAIDTETFGSLSKSGAVSSLSNTFNPFKGKVLDNVYELAISETRALSEIINIYPNPFNSRVSVEMNVQDDYMIQLYNITGALINEKFFYNSKRLIISDLGVLSLGTYFLKIVDSNGNVIGVKKLIKL